jgi:hypothetical protein
MRLCFLFLSLFLTFSAFAFDDVKVAEKLGLDTGLTGQPWTFLGTHSVFVNEDFSRQMMVVRNVPGKLKVPQFIEADGYLIVNFPEGPETITSIALVGISRDAVLPYLEHVTSSWKDFFTIIPRAHAATCDLSGLPSTPGLGQLTTFFTTGSGAGFARCLMNFVQGAWSSTGGVVVGFIQGVANLARDPKAFWNRRVTQMQNMWKFVSHFRESMSHIGHALSGLSAETMTQMMCAFLGGVGVRVAIALMTGGAGLGPLLEKVTSYVAKIAGLSRVFALLGRLNRMSSIPGKFFEGIAGGKIGQAVIDRADAFARNKMDKMVEGAIKCAL